MEENNNMNLFEKDKLYVKWFENNQWKIYLFTESDDSLYSETDDGARITVYLDNQKQEKDNLINLSRMTVNVSHNKDGVISGIQIVVPLDPAVQCTWKPHLAPFEEMIIGDKVFRSPSVVLESQTILSSFIPDLNDMKTNR